MVFAIPNILRIRKRCDRFAGNICRHCCDIDVQFDANANALSQDGKLLVRDLNFCIERGVNCMVSGPNGAPADRPTDSIVFVFVCFFFLRFFVSVWSLSF
jgi:hypothetical protein